MKKIFFAGIISCLIVSCTKERMGNNMTQINDSIAQNRNDLHPTGVKLYDPSLVERVVRRVGYYAVDNRTRRLASSIDLSGIMPAIGNQGSQNSCTGWAV